MAKDIDQIVDDAQTGGPQPKKDPCAALAAKAARQPAGSARKKMAERALRQCRQSNAQNTDSNN